MLRRVSSVESPLGALTAGGGQFAVVEPFVINTRNGDPEASIRVMDIMRKIGNMAVTAMEQNGCPARGELEAALAAAKAPPS